MSDGLSWLAIDLHGRALDWRMRRQASRRSAVWAALDSLLLVALIALAVWGLA